MSPFFQCRWAWVFVLLCAPPAAVAQAASSPSRVGIAAGGGFLTSGAYFTGPGSMALASGDAFAGMLQVSVAVHRSLAVVVAGAHARPDWRLTGVPLIGTVGVPGARLWFADAAIRGRLPVGTASLAPAVFAQVGPGLAHYDVSLTAAGTGVDEHATNFALAVGAGLALPLTKRLGLEVMVKDYVASFRSVRDLEEFGIEGRRAHTVLLLLNARLGL